jgi:hypothetical protein
LTAYRALDDTHGVKECPIKVEHDEEGTVKVEVVPVAGGDSKEAAT